MAIIRRGSKFPPARGDLQHADDPASANGGGHPAATVSTTTRNTTPPPMQLSVTQPSTTAWPSHPPLYNQGCGPHCSRPPLWAGSGTAQSVTALPDVSRQLRAPVSVAAGVQVGTLTWTNLSTLPLEFPTYCVVFNQANQTFLRCERRSGTSMSIARASNQQHRNSCAASLARPGTAFSQHAANTTGNAAVGAATILYEVRLP